LQNVSCQPLPCREYFSPQKRNWRSILHLHAFRKVLRGQFITCSNPYKYHAEYGGTLPRLQDLDDPLRPNHALPYSSGHFPSTNSTTTTQPLPIRISPTSSQNPFFGYPTLFNSFQTTPSFQPGHRRLRDLLRTLAIMWWDRWKPRISVLLWFVLALAGARIWVKRGGMARLGEGMVSLARWKDLWVTGLG